ncbi:MAG: mannitol dehydrogenase family protein [Halioglobus sp.]
MKRLTSASELGVAGVSKIPRYHRDNTEIGIVHFGIGAFHRAHQAVYTEDVMNRQGGNWAICGVSLRSGSVRDQLAPQNCLYTVSINSAAGSELQLVGAVKQVLVAPESPAAVLAVMSKPSVHVVTLTITEKGYCLNPATGILDDNHPDIKHDLTHPEQPRTAIGFLARALAQRHKNGMPGLTVISCDNWFANGKRLSQGVLDFCAKVDSNLPQWIQENCRFPNTMVDRIVPVTTALDRKRLADTLQVEDHACVMTEPFTQWVIEKNFAGPVPDWHLAGASLVSSVAPFEAMKLRMLNGSHSTLAYLACLAGIETVSEAIEKPEILKLIKKLMSLEMASTLTLPANFDVDAYAQQLLQRFANPALHHHTRQIAMDGSQKIPQRLLPPLSERLGKAESIDALILGVAAWIRYTRALDDAGNAYPINDPLAERLLHIHQSSGPRPEDYLPKILDISEVFDISLRNNSTFTQALANTLEQLESLGAIATAAHVAK